MIQEKKKIFEKVVMRDYESIAGIVVLRDGKTFQTDVSSHSTTFPCRKLSCTSMIR